MTDNPASLASHVRRDLSIDQQHALKTAATRLHTDFADMFGVETTERFLNSSYDQFAGRATIPNFLPLFAERWARQRLTALARVEGKITDTTPTIAAMAEVGIDITREFPKPWTDEIVQASDVVVTMRCGDACPFFPGKRYVNGDCQTRQGRASTRCVPSETTSTSACVDCSPNSISPPLREE